MTETWKSVPGYEGFYEVSDFGNVRSVERTITQVSRSGNTYQRVVKSKNLSPVIGSSGRYLYVHLAKEGKRHHSVHSLVLRAFVGEPSAGQEGCHSDGDSFNNKLSNLRWDTHQSNKSDREKHGTVLRGDSHYNSVCTENQARSIKTALSNYTGKRYGRNITIARQLNVPVSLVKDIAYGHSWQHV